jgi:hypothetical protein
MPAITDHPEFPQPESQNATLWRYLDWGKFEWLVSNGRLFMPSADRLGDHWEGTIPQGQSQWWNQRIAEATGEEQRATLLRNRDLLQRTAHRFRGHFYVSCWHRNEHENHAMWGSYTSDSESVAIKTQYNRLAAAVPDYVHMGNVRYIDYSVERPPSMNMFEVIMHKDAYFAFEQETRIVVLAPPGNIEQFAQHFAKNTFMLDGDETFRFFAPEIPVHQLLSGIVMHPKANAKFTDKVVALCEKHRLPQPVPSRRNHPLGS